jgi:hypothetical protein
MLTRLIYHSENHLGPFNGKMIGQQNAIMDVANRKNETSEITGALLFNDVWFVQVLEGERENVSATLRRIMGDERHDNVTVVDARPITSRAFANWWMGMAALRGDVRSLLLRHGVEGRFDPRTLNGDQILAIAMDLANNGLNRRLSEAA